MQDDQSTFWFPKLRTNPPVTKTWFPIFHISSLTYQFSPKGKKKRENKRFPASTCVDRRTKFKMAKMDIIRKSRLFFHC